MSDSSTPSGHSSAEGLVAVGRIIGAHGRSGEIRVKVTSDVPGRFETGQSLSLSRDGETTEDRRYRIVHSRSTGSKDNDVLILALQGLRFRDEALPLAGMWLCVPQSEVPQPEEGEYFHYQLMGLKVRTVTGEELGEVTEILETGSNDVYVVKGDGGEILVPALSKVVLEVDIAGGLMVVDVPEGLR